MVLSCGNEQGLAAAVTSVLEQGVPVETVVVNSNGGGAAETLRAAGIRVPVWECEERLNPGAARNIGIGMTSAPFVSFLAADCLAEPGWAAARLECHRAGATAVASAITNADAGDPVADASYLLLFHTRMPGTPPSERLAYGASYARWLFDRFGLFREDLRTGEDSDLHERLAGVEIEWSSRVRTAHRHPRRLAAMAREHVARGRRMARSSEARFGAPIRRLIVRAALANVRLGARASRQLAADRRHRLRVIARLPVGGLAYAAGAATAGSRRPSLADRVRRTFADVPVPSAGPSLPRRRTRLFAVLAVRDELEALPQCLADLTREVDAVVALDDGSSDGSGEWLERHPDVVEVIRLPANRGSWREMENHRLMVEAAIRHGAEWILAVDADDRLEPGFRTRAERVIARGGLLGFRAYAIRRRELWEGGNRYRCDGVWGRKTVVRLFEARGPLDFSHAELHADKAPLSAMLPGLKRFPLADLETYHLAMLTADMRAARRRRYEHLDPQARWQRIGYAYMTDETGLELHELAPGRGWAHWLREALSVVLAAGLRRRGRAAAAVQSRAAPSASEERVAARRSPPRGGRSRPAGRR